MKNRCTHLGKQVHPIGETGAPIWGNRCTCSGESIMVESTKVICAKTRIYNFYATSLSRTDVRIINSQLSIINSQLSIVNSQLSILNCQLNLWRWRESRSALPLLQSTATKRTLTRVRVPTSEQEFVEMEGVEPSSAQGNHTLSTRLFQT